MCVQNLREVPPSPPNNTKRSISLYLYMCVCLFKWCVLQQGWTMCSNWTNYSKLNYEHKLKDLHHYSKRTKEITFTSHSFCNSSSIPKLKRIILVIHNCELMECENSQSNPTTTSIVYLKLEVPTLWPHALILFTSIKLLLGVAILH